MRQRSRGIVMIVVAIVGIVVNILDGAHDGFSVWNGVAIACFVVMLLYGYLALPNARPPR